MYFRWKLPLRAVLVPLLGPALLTACQKASPIDPGQVIEKSDCSACHAITGMEMRIGPPFEAIALRYAGEGDAVVVPLAAKIRSGGAGAWGYVPMISHPQLSQAESEAVVHWILNRKPASAADVAQPSAKSQP